MGEVEGGSGTGSKADRRSAFWIYGVEASSVQSLTEAAAPWGPFLQFESHPVMDVTGSVPILQRAYGWRDSVR